MKYLITLTQYQPHRGFLLNMVIKELYHLPRSTVEQLLLAIPFYKAVKQQDTQQFEELLKHSRIVNYDPGEVVLESGSRDCWVFFLLKGELEIVVKDSQQGQVVNHVTPGEVFGDMALLIGDGRTASVRASKSARDIMIFATNFDVFGALEQFQPIKRSTKLIYYRNCVHNLRWKLEVYRSRYPAHELASAHHQVKLYTGPKDTTEELHALHSQAVELAHLLHQWNEEFGRINDAEFTPDQIVLSQL